MRVRNDLQSELFALSGDGEEKHLTIDLVASIIGIDLAAALAERFGGGRIYVPQFPNEGHPIARCIGIDAARQLGLKFGGEDLEIPLVKSRAQRRRDRERILDLDRRGWNRELIQREVKCSRRHVYNVLSEK